MFLKVSMHSEEVDFQRVIDEKNVQMEQFRMEAKELSQAYDDLNEQVCILIYYSTLNVIFCIWNPKCMNKYVEIWGFLHSSFLC